jgi:hypothetical protein
VVEPLLYGHSTGLSPFSVVVAAIFWSWIWGPIGLILSTPLTLCLLVLGRHVRRLEFLDVLLGDQPALTPIENFYQRALAGDPDEALAQAEVLLRDRSLCTYYDEVALKGLQLAANDVQRGGVSAAQLARIESTTNDLVEGLDSYADHEPALDEQENNLTAVAATEAHPLSPTEERDTSLEGRSADASEADAVNRMREGLNEDANEGTRDATGQSSSRRNALRSIVPGTMCCASPAAARSINWRRASSCKSLASTIWIVACCRMKPRHAPRSTR